MINFIKNFTEREKKNNHEIKLLYNYFLEINKDANIHTLNSKRNIR